MSEKVRASIRLRGHETEQKARLYIKLVSSHNNDITAAAAALLLKTQLMLVQLSAPALFMCLCACVHTLLSLSLLVPTDSHTV